ncbi:MAG TPA: hypothetical protein VEH51_04885 [Burkholderiales bacterium]|nr:hypothetical protein [Burkholderiales bacterium]
MSALPDVAAWRAAAARFAGLFAALDAGARVGLVARAQPASMLLWEVGAEGVAARVAPFPGFASCGLDMLLSADPESMGRIRDAVGGDLFAALRADIRQGGVVCYMLRRRCDLEARGFEDLLEALGFAFMGACR